MKKHIKILSILTLSIALISLLVASTNNSKLKIAETYKAEESGQYKDFYLEKGDALTKLSNGSWYIANDETNTYIFQAIELGDWDYTFNNIEDLNKCVQTYINIQNAGNY
jgi:hypothetical protein